MRHATVWRAACAAALAALALALPAAASDAVKLEVLNPSPVIEAPHNLAPRLSTLNGKTVALWLSSEDPLYGHGAVLLESLGQAIARLYPGVRLIPYTELPRTYKPEDEVLAAILAKRPDAVIGGVGG